ncbi:MAG: thioredoxin family protein [Cyclobacteriaceae bacterium]
MSLTYSEMMPLGTTAPDFELPDTISGKTMSLGQIKSDIATVVMFICNHCPYVIHVEKEMAAIANEYKKKGVAFAAISANDVENYPDDSPEKMKAKAKEVGYSFPYLYDETQEVAKAYQAACTPDFYVFDKNLTCVYRGRMDESSPGNGKPVTGKELRATLDAVIAGTPVSQDQLPSMGCNIKWKK